MGTACGPGTMRALSQLPQLLPCLATCFSLLLSSVFLPPWLRVGMGWHLYLDTANSLLGDQNQPLIQGRVEVAFPLLGWDLTGKAPSWEGRSHPGPQGTSSSGSCSEAPVCVLCLLKSSLSP